MTTKKKSIIISGVNFTEGGPLTVMKSFLEFINSSIYAKQFQVYALVHSKELYRDLNYINFLEYPHVKFSWINRIKFEYFDCLRLSVDLESYLWISMHDITPNVISEKRVVYCHNPSPFYKQHFMKLFKNPKGYIYTKFYKNLYGINIKKNDYVIVQQKWIKDKFVQLFKLGKERLIISIPNENIMEDNQYLKMNKHQEDYCFFYPAFPREFKNFELICEAVKKLNNSNLNKNYRILLTIDGSENEYSRLIYNKYKNIKNIEFIGLQSREEIEEYYKTVDVLIFPSKLETWGLPISEFKLYNKPILVADLPYAYETVGDYAQVRYFDPNKAKDLMDCMKNLMENRIIFNNKGAIIYQRPVCYSWEELMKVLLNEKNFG